MDSKEGILSKNIREFYAEGNSSLKKGSYNSAASLFFKALAVLSDMVILQQKGFIPKSHAERFRILEQSYPDIYAIMDKDFPLYQDSYSLSISKALAKVIKNKGQSNKRLRKSLMRCAQNYRPQAMHPPL